MSLKFRASDDFSALLEHALIELIYPRPLRMSKRVSVFLKPCMKTMNEILRIRWSRGSVLAFGTKVRGFKPERSRRIFKGK